MLLPAASDTVTDSAKSPSASVLTSVVLKVSVPLDLLTVALMLTGVPAASVSVAVTVPLATTSASRPVIV